MSFKWTMPLQVETEGRKAARDPSKTEKDCPYENSWFHKHMWLSAFQNERALLEDKINPDKRHKKIPGLKKSKRTKAQGG